MSYNISRKVSGSVLTSRLASVDCSSSAEYELNSLVAHLLIERKIDLMPTSHICTPSVFILLARIFVHRLQFCVAVGADMLQSNCADWGRMGSLIGSSFCAVLVFFTTLLAALDAAFNCLFFRFFGVSHVVSWV